MIVMPLKEKIKQRVNQLLPAAFGDDQVFRFFLLIALLPIVELWLLIEIGKVIGSGLTILLVLGTALLGAFMVRSQGFYIFARICSDLEQGILPGESLYDGLCVLVGGILLITPGLITDLSGFLLLIPYTRRWFKTLMRSLLRRLLQRGIPILKWRW